MGLRVHSRACHAMARARHSEGKQYLRVGYFLLGELMETRFRAAQVDAQDNQVPLAAQGVMHAEDGTARILVLV